MLDIHVNQPNNPKFSTKVFMKEGYLSMNEMMESLTSLLYKKNECIL